MNEEDYYIVSIAAINDDDYVDDDDDNDDDDDDDDDNDDGGLLERLFMSDSSSIGEDGEIIEHGPAWFTVLACIFFVVYTLWWIFVY